MSGGPSASPNTVSLAPSEPVPPSGEVDQVTRDAILASHTEEAQGFYNLVMTVATSFLGGTLLFVEKVASPVPASLWLIAIGWILLVGSIGCIAWARRINLWSGGAALGRREGESREHDRVGNRFTTAGTLLLVAGMLSVTLAGIVGLRQGSSKEGKGSGMANEKEGGAQPPAPDTTTRETPGEVRKTINYGNTGNTGGGSGSQGGNQGSSGQGPKKGS